MLWRKLWDIYILYEGWIYYYFLLIWWFVIMFYHVMKHELFWVDLKVTFLAYWKTCPRKVTCQQMTCSGTQIWCSVEEEEEKSGKAMEGHFLSFDFQPNVRRWKCVEKESEDCRIRSVGWFWKGQEREWEQDGQCLPNLQAAGWGKENYK